MHSSQSHEKADLGSLIKKYISLKNNIQKITCSICSKNFLSKSALKAHTQFIHQDNHILNCPYKNCKKLFNNRYRLDIHIMTHKGIKPFKCSLCGKAFSEQGTLNSQTAGSIPVLRTKFLLTIYQFLWYNIFIRNTPVA